MGYPPKTRAEADAYIADLQKRLQKLTRKMQSDVRGDDAVLFAENRVLFTLIAQWKVLIFEGSISPQIVESHLLGLANGTLKRVRNFPRTHPFVGSRDTLMRVVTATVEAFKANDFVAANRLIREFWLELVQVRPSLHEYRHVLTPVFVQQCYNLNILNEELEQTQRAKSSLPNSSLEPRFMSLKQRVEMLQRAAQPNLPAVEPRIRAKPKKLRRKYSPPPMALSPEEATLQRAKETLYMDEWKSADYWRKSKTSERDTK